MSEELPAPTAFRWCEFGEYRFSSAPPMHVPPRLEPLYTADQMRAAVQQERERCAKVAESHPSSHPDDSYAVGAAIRKGETP